MYRWVVFVHILAAIAFFIAHGASVVMAFQLRRERELERIGAILDLSNAALPFAYWAFMILILAGIIAGIMANWFALGWIWVSLVLIVLLWFGMHAYGAMYYTPIRKAVGLPYRDKGDQPALPPASEMEIAAAIRASNPGLLAGVSFALVAVILWLMVFKPF
ncbi:MAG: hypothetical protein IT320_06860 [Anaerolineae bacterium]|nr:hypothetical protein [Anaerolineae bacterium]